MKSGIEPGIRKRRRKFLLATAALAGLAITAAGITASLAQTVELETVVVDKGKSSSSLIGPPPPAYAGGQVATGSQLGILGNRSVFDTPFNTTSYTAKTIQDQQATTIADVFANNPSVRSPQGGDGVYDNFIIRGFPVTNAVFTLNGLPGVVPAQMVSPEFIERLELLNGPSGLLNNVPLFGYVGGTVNIVPKRATDAPITDVTARFQSTGQVGTHIDFGRRYGTNKEWGVRINTAYRDGDLPADNQGERLGMAAIALDYLGAAARFSLDAGYQNQKTDAPFISMLYNGPPGRLPDPPKAGSNPFQPWSYNHAKDIWSAVRGEVDLTDNIVAYAAAGYRDSVSVLLSPYQEIENRKGDTTVYPYYEPYTTKNIAAEVGTRAKFQTGPISHQLNTGYAIHKSAIGYSDTFFGSFASNLYAPAIGPEPNVAGLSDDPPTTNRNNLQSVAVSDTLSLMNDRLQLIAGARYQNIQSKNFSPITGNPRSSYDEGAVTPAVGIIVKPLQNVSLYANYIEGLAQGPIAPTGTTNAGEVFAPTVSRQIEGGVKVDFGSLGATISLFEITRPSGLTDPATKTFTVDGEQRNRGIELNVFGEVRPGIRALGGVAFIDGVLTATAGGLNDGRTAPGVPEVTVNLGGEWDLPYIKGLTASARIIYTSEQYLDAANTQIADAWVRGDVGLRYVTNVAGVPTTFRANIENVTDESYWSSTAGGTLSLGAARRYLASATAHF